MKAVAFVIYNRTQSGLYPGNFCEVVLQPKQFSFTADRNPDNIRDWNTYQKILAIAVELVENGGFHTENSPVGDALYFNSFRKRTRWVYARGCQFIATIGNLHFFK